METNPRRMEFWTQHVPVAGKIETCRTVFPKHDLGQWEDFGLAHCFVFATIERPGRSEVRAIHAGFNGMSLHSIRVLE